MPEDASPSLYSIGFRQGSLLDCSKIPESILEDIQNSRACIQARNKPIKKKDFLVVLSQDCDLNSQNASDKYIELINLSSIKSKDKKAFLHDGINTRKLQVHCVDEVRVCVLENISLVEKSVLQAIEEAPSLCLNSREKSIIIDWRVSRYKREPLPDKFNEFFIFGQIKNAENGFEEFLKKNYDQIVSVFVYIYPAEEGQPEYKFSLTAVLSADCNLELEEEIKTKFEDVLEAVDQGDNPIKSIQLHLDDYADFIQAHNISIEIVDSIANFTLHDAAIMTRLNLQYLCYPLEG